MYDHAGHLLGEYDQAGGLIQELVWLGDIPVATLRPGAGGAGSPGGSTVAVYFIHTDHLNAPVKLTRPADGRVVWRWDHDPYGNGTPNEDPDGDGAALRLNLRFAGQYADAETGLYYNMARYYDPLTGRYTQSDPIGLAGGLNTYGYVGGDPVNRVDPWGLDNPGMGPYGPLSPVTYCYGRIRTYDHAFVCSGGKCAGLMPADTSWLYGPGKIWPEKENQEICKPMDVPQSCNQTAYESCVAKKVAETGKTHFYGLITYNCVSWARDVILECQQLACKK